MPSRISWTNLLPGLVAIAVIVALAVGALVFGGVARTRGDTIRLYVLTSQAQGVMRGTEVWLVGQKIGTVDRIEFRPATVDTAQRVVLVLTVNADDIGLIRHDSDAQIRTGGTVIGPAVVYLAAGTAGSPAAKPGDTLAARPASDLVVARAKLSSVAADLGPIMADVKTVLGQIRGRRGSTALVNYSDGEVERIGAQVSRLSTRMSFADIKSGDAMTHARNALARVDSIRELLASPTTSFGRFRRDSTLRGSIANVRVELSHVREKLASTDGTLGRLSGDSAITRALANAQQEMTLLLEDVKRRPTKYIHFSLP
jgi:phospholipid/cholesterol/gamma-HCH transport system substrate-binding protein